MASTAVLHSRSILGNALVIRVTRPGGSWACQPGQFFMLRCGPSWSPYLRRALFPTQIDPAALSFLIRPTGDPGIAWLANQRDGAELDLMGPFGRGFVSDPLRRHLLLVTEALAVAPLLSLIAPALARRTSIELLLHARQRADLLPSSALPPAVEYYTACDDPLPGQPAVLDDELLRALTWADSLCVAGGDSFLRSVRQAVVDARFAVPRGFAQALAPATLPCGVGACLACLVDTGRGLHRACIRGPVFDLVDLAL